MGGACSAYGERRGVYKVLVEKPEGKRQFGGHRHRWENNIKTNLQNVGCGGGWVGSNWFRIGTGGGHL
jgi:hypothetical protein